MRMVWAKQRNLFTVLNWLVNAVQLHSPHTNTHWFHIKRLVFKWPQRTASYKHKLQQRQRFCHLGLKYVIKNLSFCNKVDLLARFFYSSTAVSLFSRQKNMRDTNQYKTIDRLFLQSRCGNYMIDGSNIRDKLVLILPKMKFDYIHLFLLYLIEFSFLKCWNYIFKNRFSYNNKMQTIYW